MHKILDEKNTTTLFNEADASDFFESLSKASTWQRCYAKEISAVGISPNPIMMDVIRTQSDIHSSVSDESIAENMETLSLGLRVPVENHYETYPLGETAFSTLADRAGYGKNSPAIMTLKKKNGRSPMDEDQRATVLNYGLKSSEDRVWVLIRDEKVRATLSGDDSDYNPIDFTELMGTLKEGLRTEFKNVYFGGATADHYYSTCLYLIQDTNLKNSIVDAFSAGCIDVTDYTPSIRLITSDVGICGVNIYPYLKSGTRTFMLGRPLTLTHRYGNALEDFKENVEKCFSLFKETAEKISAMADISIRHPSGCLQKTAKACGLTKKIAIEEAVVFEKMYGSSATQLDVYWELQDIFEKMETDKLSESRKIFLQENITRLCFCNIADYDIPYTWE